MPTVFLSYRRSDTGGEVGRLADSLTHKLGRKVVFRDVSDIPPGAAFAEVLEKELAAAKLVLVLIGPAWIGELEQRLKQPDIDYLRVEVATALSMGKRVIPVLLKGAALPPVDALPEDLVSLAKRQAMTMREESWSTDVDRMIDAIGRPYRWDLLALRACIAFVAIVVAVPALGPQLAVDRARCLMWTLLGIYGLIEFFRGFLYFRKLRRGYLA